MKNLSRRGFVGGLIAIAAPAIVRPGILMPIKVIEPIFTVDMLKAVTHYYKGTIDGAWFPPEGAEVWLKSRIRETATIIRTDTFWDTGQFGPRTTAVIQYI